MVRTHNSFFWSGVFGFLLVLLFITTQCSDNTQMNSSTPPSSVSVQEKPAENKNASSRENDVQKSDLISGHPVQCEPHMGFDSYRTFESFTIDPNDSNTLYVTIEYKGVYKSIDGGKTWKKMNNGLRGYPNAKNISEPCQPQHPYLLIDPTNSNRILLTTATNPGPLNSMNSENGGVYESLDGGEQWHSIFSEDMNAWTYDALVIDPTHPQVIYVGTTAMPGSYDEADPTKIFVTEGIVYKSEDSGKNWVELKTGFVPQLRAGKLFINPTNAQHLLLTTLALPPNRGGGEISTEQLGILETRDGGQTWKTQESLPENARGIRYAEVAPRNFNNLFLVVAKSNEEEVTYYSIDQGKTFNEVNTPVNLMRYDPNDSTGMRILGVSIYAQPRDIFESLDGGKTWNSWGKLPDEVTNEYRISNIVWDENNASVLYITGDMGRIWKSTDHAKTWTRLLSIEELS